ncbi:MAG: MarR family winged helix-turn-helix transcriptional regulator [Patescibacteria group bacterium]
MFDLVKKIQTAIKHRTTYRVGLLHAKVYRLLKVITGEKLLEHNISTIDWALLGILYDDEKGLRFSALSDELIVEPPFVTVLVRELTKKELVETKSDPLDSRAKNVFITAKGRKFVEKVEVELRVHMKFLAKGIPKTDLITHLSVIEKMIENGGGR